MLLLNRFSSFLFSRTIGMILILLFRKSKCFLVLMGNLLRLISKKNISAVSVDALDDKTIDNLFKNKESVESNGLITGLFKELIKDAITERR